VEPIKEKFITSEIMIYSMRNTTQVVYDNKSMPFKQRIVEKTVSEERVGSHILSILDQKVKLPVFEEKPLNEENDVEVVWGYKPIDLPVEIKTKIQLDTPYETENGVKIIAVEILTTLNWSPSANGFSSTLI